MASRMGLQSILSSLLDRSILWTKVLLVSFLVTSTAVGSNDDFDFFDLESEDPEASSEKTITEIKKKEPTTAPTSTDNEAKTPESEASIPTKTDLSEEVRSAEDLIRKKKYKEATVIYWKNIETLRRRELIFLIRCHEILKEWSEISRASNLLIAKNPEDAEALSYAGVAAFHRGQQSESKAHLVKSLELNPKLRPPYEILSMIYKDNPYERRLLFMDMMKHFGPEPEILAKLCELNTLDGDNNQAEKTCSQAIEKDPKNPANHVYMGLIAKNRGEKEQAKELLKKAADRFPQSEFSLVEYATLAEAEKNHLDAFKYYELCLEVVSGSEKCLVGLGNASVQLQRYERALDVYREVCRKYGRKHTAAVRRAIHLLRSRGESDWISKYSAVADSCAIL